MAVVLDKKDGKYFKNRKRRHKEIVISSVTSIIIIVAIVVMFLIYQMENLNYSDYTITQSIEREDSAYTEYVSYNGGVLRYSKDGAMFSDIQGESIWNSTYDMNKPVTDICEGYLVISDVGNKKIEIFNESGHVSSLEVLYPIIKAEVASQGVVAALMDGGDVNYIQVYSPTGQNLIDSRTTVEKNGFAADLSMSDNGEKLVTSYISINAGMIQSKVTFYNFGGVGQNYQAKVVGGFDYGQTLVSKVEFMDNNTIVVFGDDRLSIYNMEEIPKLIFEETFQEEIRSIAYNEEYIGIIQNKAEGDDRYLVTVYNNKGDKVLNQGISYNYDHFEITNNELIFYSKTDLNILRVNGKEKCNLRFDTNIANVLPLSLKEGYLIVDQSNINKIKLSK